MECQKKYIKLPTDGLLSLHFFAENIMFPVVVAAYNENEQINISYLEHNIQHSRINTIELCRWCETHNMLYQIMYPLSRRQIYRHPYKYFIYQKIRHELKYNQYTI